METATLKIEQPTYTCPTHGDQTNVYMQVQIFSKHIDNAFCLECLCEKFKEIGIQELKQE